MKEILGVLVFDSWRDSLPDLRGPGNRERHLIYEGPGLLLDLHLKPGRNGASLEMTGQVMPMNNLAQSVSHVPVVLESGANCSSTLTNALGEFSFKQLPGEGFDLSVVFGNRRFVVRGLESEEPRDWTIVALTADVRAAKGSAR